MAASSWLVGALAGGLGALAGGVLASAWVDLSRPDRTDVGAAWLIAVMVVAGGLLCLLLGWLVARQGTVGLARALAWSCGPPLAVTALALAAVWWKADVAPTLDGRPLMLVVELRAPASRPLADGPEFGVGLRVGGTVKDYQRVERVDVRQTDGHWLLGARVPLRTQSGAKRLFANVGGPGSLVFALPLRGRPQHEDQSWSAWLTPDAAAGAPEPWQARYRVEPVEADGRAVRP